MNSPVGALPRGGLEEWTASDARDEVESAFSLCDADVPVSVCLGCLRGRKSRRRGHDGDLPGGFLALHARRACGIPWSEWSVISGRCSARRAWARRLALRDMLTYNTYAAACGGENVTR